jgi:hypothetical protein
MQNQINTKAIVLHSVCFGMFLLSEFLMFLEIVIGGYLHGREDYSGTPSKRYAKTVISVWIVALFMQFITQMSLLLIFTELGKKQEQDDPLDTSFLNFL